MVSGAPTLMIPPRWTLSTRMISETSGSMSAGEQDGDQEGHEAMGDLLVECEEGEP